MADLVTVKRKNSTRGRTNSKISPPAQVLEMLNHFLHTAQDGYIVLGVQDGYVVKVEKVEKFVISIESRKSGYIISDKAYSQHPLQAKILAELQTIQYGQLIVRLTKGQVKEIEKVQKNRVDELEGMHGDGI
jgi:hypothetical protein